MFVRKLKKKIVGIEWQIEISNIYASHSATSFINFCFEASNAGLSVALIEPLSGQ